MAGGDQLPDQIQHPRYAWRIHPVLLQLLAERDRLEAQGGQHRPDVVVYLTGDSTSFLLLGRFQVARQLPQARFAFGQGGRGRAPGTSLRRGLQAAG